MPIPQTLLRWFESDLQPGEIVRSAANADLWLRYRRLVLTDRRILAVERFNVLHPRRGRVVESIPLESIEDFRVERGRFTTKLRVRATGGQHLYGMLNRSLGTGRFAAAVEDVLSPSPGPSPTP